MKSWNFQKKCGTNSTHRLEMSYIPIPNDLSEIHRDTSLETGQRPQLSTNRSWQTLKGTKWRQNKSSQVEMTTQAKSGLLVDKQPLYLTVSVPTWIPEIKKHSSKLWKRLDGYPFSALLQARKITERQKSLPLQPFASHNMQNTRKTNMLKTTLREWSSLTKTWRRFTKQDTKAQSCETPHPFSKEAFPINGVIEEERSSEEEVLGTLLLKNLFLREAGEGDSSTRPRQTKERY